MDENKNTNNNTPIDERIEVVDKGLGFLNAS